MRIELFDCLFGKPSFRLVNEKAKQEILWLSWCLLKRWWFWRADWKLFVLQAHIRRKRVSSTAGSVFHKIFLEVTRNLWRILDLNGWSRRAYSFNDQYLVVFVTNGEINGTRRAEFYDECHKQRVILQKNFLQSWRQCCSKRSSSFQKGGNSRHSHVRTILKMWTTVFPTITMTWRKKKRVWLTNTERSRSWPRGVTGPACKKGASDLEVDLRFGLTALELCLTINYHYGEERLVYICFPLYHRDNVGMRPGIFLLTTC